MKIIGSLLVVLGLYFGAEGFYGVFFPSQTAIQQNISAILLVSGVLSFVGGAILFALGDIYKILKDIKKGSQNSEQKIFSKCSICGEPLNILDKNQTTSGKCPKCSAPEQNNSIPKDIKKEPEKSEQKSFSKCSICGKPLNVLDKNQTTSGKCLKCSAPEQNNFISKDIKKEPEKSEQKSFSKCSICGKPLDILDKNQTTTGKCSKCLADEDNQK